MLDKTRIIMSDLNRYLMEGTDPIYGTPSNFNNTYNQYVSTIIDNVAYKFVNHYDDVDSLPNDGTHTCIPVLIVQNVDLYKKSKKVLYHNRFIDLATLFRTSDLPDGYPAERIYFYVVPFISSTSQNVVGTIYYDVIIDYNTEYDVYSIMSKEISQIVMNHYYRRRNTPHYNIKQDGYEMYFVPNNMKILDNTNTLFHRIWQYYNVRVCSVR